MLGAVDGGARPQETASVDEDREPGSWDAELAQVGQPARS